MQECNRQQVDISHVQRLIPLIMGHLQGLAPGQYLLTHEPGEAAVSCFTAHINATKDEPVRIMHQELLFGDQQGSSVCIMDKKLLVWCDCLSVHASFTHMLSDALL